MKLALGKVLAVWLAGTGISLLSMIPATLFSKEAFVVTAFMAMGWMFLGVSVGLAYTCYQLWTDGN